MPEIKNFIAWLKEKGIKKIHNFNRLLNEYGSLDSIFVFDNWSKLLAELKKSNITVAEEK